MKDRWSIKGQKYTNQELMTKIKKALNFRTGNWIWQGKNCVKLEVRGQLRI
jgi:hypothetical protein